MRITITALLAAGLLGLTSNLFAAGQAFDRGMTQDAVRKQFGNPVRQVAPVGTPPISRWIYDDFTVYFEGKYSIHAVQHAKTLTTPATAPAATAATPSSGVNVVDELPAIEEIGTPAAEPAETPCRFDPATGRIVEFGPDGKAIQPPTAQPAVNKAAPVEEPAATEPAKKEKKSKAAATVAPAAAAAAATEAPASTAPTATAAPKSAPAKAAAPANKATTESAPAAKQPAAAPAAAAGAASEAPADAGRFRFDPATGRIVMDEPAPVEEAPAPAAEATPAKEATAEQAPAEPAAAKKAPAEEPKKQDQPAANKPAPTKPAAEKGQQDDSGFSLSW